MPESRTIGALKVSCILRFSQIVGRADARQGEGERPAIGLQSDWRLPGPGSQPAAGNNGNGPTGIEENEKPERCCLQVAGANLKDCDARDHDSDFSFLKALVSSRSSDSRIVLPFQHVSPGGGLRSICVMRFNRVEDHFSSKNTSLFLPDRRTSLVSESILMESESSGLAVSA